MITPPVGWPLLKISSSFYLFSPLLFLPLTYSSSSFFYSFLLYVADITVELNCRLLQSQTIRGYLWILCATSDDHFMLRQIFAPSYSTCCFLDLFNYNITYKGSVSAPSSFVTILVPELVFFLIQLIHLEIFKIPYIIQWWINGNGTRLLIASGLNFAMYGIHSF